MTTPSYRDRPGAPAPGTRLCALDEIREPGARGFLFGEGTARFDMFIVRQGDEVVGYVNECPHAFTPLETWADKFLTLAEDEIICSTHGALFRIEDGLCTSGPCTGKRLIPVPVAVKDGMVIISG
ncbi:Rieske (2Fe-2S) protein [Pyruvatibacter mobilis]|uniref:Rieske (2Fe-2S) protein n=1 Tax=Pyruvatibacter mobilis TaxID=1712261 RepID=UPI003BAAF4C4